MAQNPILLSEGIDFENPYLNFIKEKGFLPDDRDANYSKPETFISPVGSNPNRVVQSQDSDRIIRLQPDEDLVRDITISWHNIVKSTAYNIIGRGTGDYSKNMYRHILIPRLNKGAEEAIIDRGQRSTTSNVYSSVSTDRVNRLLSLAKVQNLDNIFDINNISDPAFYTENSVLSIKISNAVAGESFDIEWWHKVR